MVGRRTLGEMQEKGSKFLGGRSPSLPIRYPPPKKVSLSTGVRLTAQLINAVRNGERDGSELEERNTALHLLGEWGRRGVLEACGENYPSRPSE